MSSDTPEIASGWQPPESLRQPLKRGVIGATASGGITIAATLAELLGVAGSEKWSSLLGLIAVVPQIAVLTALVRLGQASSDVGPAWERLARAAGSAFGLMWLIAAMSFAMDVVPESGPAVFITFLVAGLILIGLIALGTTEGAGPIALLTFFGVRFGLGWWLIGRKLPGDMAIIGTTVLLTIGCSVAFPIWFAVELWNRRGKLGPAAGVLAAVVLLGLVGFVAVLGWIVFTLANTPDPFGQMEDAEALLKPHVQAGLVLTLLSDAAAALAAALLFRGVAARLPAEPEAP
jgi:hypothetical protein